MSTEEQKKVTIRELQTFIDAVEFASDTDDWIPSGRQWKRIREMINALHESAPPAPAAPPRPVQQPTPMYASPSAFPPPNNFARPAPTPAVPTPPSAFAPPPTPGPGFANPSASAIPVKTPDIDTSSGNYQSGYV